MLGILTFLGFLHFLHFLVFVLPLAWKRKRGNGGNRGNRGKKIQIFLGFLHFLGFLVFEFQINRLRIQIFATYCLIYLVLYLYCVGSILLTNKIWSFFRSIKWNNLKLQEMGGPVRPWRGSCLHWRIEVYFSWLIRQNCWFIRNGNRLIN